MGVLHTSGIGAAVGDDVITKGIKWSSASTRAAILVLDHTRSVHHPAKTETKTKLTVIDASLLYKVYYIVHVSFHT